MSDTLQDYKKLSAELKELNKQKKALKVVAKQEGIKLTVARGKKDRCQEYNDLQKAFGEGLQLQETLNKIDKVFKETTSLDKPQGQKWVIFTLAGNYSFAILNNNIKPKKD